MNIIAQRFDKAATAYDQSAQVQAQIAAKLVARVMLPDPPLDILDIGCGTGLVAASAAQRWPQASMTALDISNAMLQEAQRKVPHLKLVTGDAAQADMAQTFDLIFSSMALHWLPDPLGGLRRWQGWLKPQGRLFVALPVAGSFKEWHDLCATSGIKDGLWPLPDAHFADDVAYEVDLENDVISYSSAAEFLRRIKSIGAATADKNHRPMNIPVMRKLLAQAPRPFAATYRIAYITISSTQSI